MVTSVEQAKKNSLKMARSWAKAGNVYMAQSFLNQATSCGFVSNRQVMALNRMLDNAREERRNREQQSEL